MNMAPAYRRQRIYLRKDSGESGKWQETHLGLYQKLVPYGARGVRYPITAIDCFTAAKRLNVRRLRIIPVFWLILWMLAIPLIHIHPDADQHHGIAEHDHGGVFHTVFSQDLDGEYGHHAHTHDAPVIQPSVFPFLGAATGLLSHPEIGFSFLSSSPDQPSVKQALSHAVLAEVDLTLPTRPGLLTRRDIFPAPSLLLLAHDLSGRAPPAISI